MKISVKALRDYLSEPIFVKTEDAVCEDVSSVVDSQGNKFPAQKCDGGVIAILTQKMGEEKEYDVSCEECNFSKIELVKDGECLKVLYDGKQFTSYIYSSEFKKPFLGAVYTKTGESFTRADLHNEEHPHQRSVFYGVGDVNGVDLWNEPEDSGYIKKGEAEIFANGNAFSSFGSKNIWCDKDGKNLMDEERKYTFYNQSEDCRYLDLEIKFIASYDDVTFGKTKEAGPLGVRVNEKINVKKGNGSIINAYGAKGEDECWSKSAPWCLYSGKLDEKDCAIAVFDSQSNERFPTNWHIRDYGLFAGNNLYFRGGFDIKKGDSVSYKFRICFFNNSGESVADRYIIYNMNEDF